MNTPENDQSGPRGQPPEGVARASASVGSEQGSSLGGGPCAAGWAGLRSQLQTLSVKREEALRGWEKWKGDPCMQDVATGYAENYVALCQIIDFIKARLRVAPPDVG